MPHNPQAIERPNLPRRPTQIIGRDADIRALAEHLSARRFVTLRGPAGVGKTTIAVALAHELWNQFRDGIAFLDSHVSMTRTKSLAPQRPCLAL